MTQSPNQIIATETGPIKAAIILAALRAAGWEVVRASNPTERTREFIDGLPDLEPFRM